VLVKSSEPPPPKPKSTVIAAEATPDQGEQAANRIAEKYRAARAALERGELMVAEAHFAALLADVAVQEPTRTWAGLEAVVAAMMDGRMNDARKHASAAGEHIKGAHTAGESGFQTAVRPILEKLWDPAFVKQNDVLLGSKGSEVHMASLIAGLKNWEQGGFDQALPFLRAFSTEPSLTKDNVLAWYQKAVKGYLRDYERMKSDSFHSDPKTLESCREAIAELNKTLTLLETKGRARFNIRARQLDLAKWERTLSNPQLSSDNAASTLKDGEKLLSAIEFFAKGYRFSEIIKKLDESKDDPPGCKRASLMVVSQASLNLLTEIEADLLKGPVNLPLTLKDGTAIVSLVVKDDALYSKDQTGKVREIRWMDLAPDQVIKLNAELLKRLTAEPDRTRRMEAAIALEWLAGDRQRAIAAAESLSKMSESFKVRWDALSPGLPK
jgi:hypothetical protein